MGMGPIWFGNGVPLGGDGEKGGRQDDCSDGKHRFWGTSNQYGYEYTLSNAATELTDTLRHIQPFSKIQSSFAAPSPPYHSSVSRISSSSPSLPHPIIKAASCWSCSSSPIQHCTFAGPRSASLMSQHQKSSQSSQSRMARATRRH